MNIYISHSTGFDYKNELYGPLKELITKHELVFPHERNDTPFPTKELFLSGNVDVVIAEISYPSTGQGLELGWADMMKIPIICIVKKDQNYSESIKILSTKIVDYDQINETDM